MADYVYASGGSKGAKGFAINAARGIASTANRAADDAARLLRTLEECRVTRAERDDIRAAILDALGDVQGRAETSLDNEGLQTDLATFDFAELRLMTREEMPA